VECFRRSLERDGGTNFALWRSRGRRNEYLFVDFFCGIEERDIVQYYSEFGRKPTQEGGFRELEGLVSRNETRGQFDIPCKILMSL
jgi:hypothetical protein